MKFKALCIAFLLSPLMIPVPFVVVAILNGITYGHVLEGAFFYLPIAYLVAAILGIPMFLLLKAAGLRHWLVYLVAGAGVGLIPAFLIQRLFFNPSQGVTHFFLWMIGVGFAAMLFRLVLSVLKYDEPAKVPVSAEI